MYVYIYMRVNPRRNLHTDFVYTDIPTERKHLLETLQTVVRKKYKKEKGRCHGDRKYYH